jgi:hypothetical protein
MTMVAGATVALFPDAGPLITLAYADALDLLRKPGWPIMLVDMVLHEVTRNETPTSARIAAWARCGGVAVVKTKVFRHHTQSQAQAQAQTVSPVRKAHLGELAVQEAMNGFGLDAGRTGVFLFEDHKIARASFLLPDNCRKVSTRAYLLFLEQRGLIESAAGIERARVHRRVDAQRQARDRGDAGLRKGPGETACRLFPLGRRVAAADHGDAAVQLRQVERAGAQQVEHQRRVFDLEQRCRVAGIAQGHDAPGGARGVRALQPVAGLLQLRGEAFGHLLQRPRLRVRGHVQQRFA